MFTFILCQIILSVIVIVLLQYLYNYFKNSMTSPLEKNYISDTKEKYEKMYDLINKSQTENNSNCNNSKNSNNINSKNSNEKDLSNNDILPNNENTQKVEKC